MRHVMLEGALMQAPLAACCRMCHSKSWLGVERCNREGLASTSSKVNEFRYLMVCITQISWLSSRRVGNCLRLFRSDGMSCASEAPSMCQYHRCA